MTKAVFVLAALLVILLLVAGLFLASQSGQEASSPDRAHLVAAASPQTVPLDAPAAFPEINTWDSISFPYDSGGVAVYSEDRPLSFSEEGAMSWYTSGISADLTVPPDRVAEVNELRSVSRDALVARIMNGPSQPTEEAIAGASRICLLGMQLAASTDQTETGGCRRFEFSRYPEYGTDLFWQLLPDAGFLLRAEDGSIFEDWSKDPTPWLPIRLTAGATFVRGSATYSVVKRQSIVVGGDVFRCWLCSATLRDAVSHLWIAPGIGTIYHLICSEEGTSVRRLELKELFLLKSRTYWRHPDATHD